MIFFCLALSGLNASDAFIHVWASESVFTMCLNNSQIKLELSPSAFEPKGLLPLLMVMTSL